ncbi:CGNR zinc finger domain-containing protein OS=Streptomyces alboniger OX=132473 GN=CP975_32520 PE=4 SV=1 [Streptomyces alboniger]
MTNAERAAPANRMLAASTAHPRLTDHAGDGWPLHYRDDRLSTGAPQASLIAVGTAPHLVGRGMGAAARSTECATTLADTSRTGRRRSRSRPCAHRDAVRRHSARASSA